MEGDPVTAEDGTVSAGLVFYNAATDELVTGFSEGPQITSGDYAQLQGPIYVNWAAAEGQQVVSGFNTGVVPQYSNSGIDWGNETVPAAGTVFADLNAAQSLRSRNLASESDLLGLESELAAAKAELEMANQAIADLVAQAPFNGVVNQKFIEVGGLVQPGTSLMQVVQVDRLKATAQIPQQAVHQVAEGQLVSVRLLDGDELSGRVRFLASAADTGTRSFAIEVEVDNPQQRRIAGGSANLAIALPEVGAHHLSPAFLALDNNGKPGVKHVGDDNKVVFSQVRLLSVKTDGAWVGGLPDNLRLITRGAGFVSEGEEVTAVAANNGEA
jgi:multidrug efflux system membrane fusion protein